MHHGPSMRPASSLHREGKVLEVEGSRVTVARRACAREGGTVGGSGQPPPPVPCHRHAAPSPPRPPHPVYSSRLGVPGSMRAGDSTPCVAPRSSAAATCARPPSDTFSNPQRQPSACVSRPPSRRAHLRGRGGWVQREEGRGRARHQGHRHGGARGPGGRGAGWEAGSEGGRACTCEHGCGAGTSTARSQARLPWLRGRGRTRRRRRA